MSDACPHELRRLRFPRRTEPSAVADGPEMADGQLRVRFAMLRALCKRTSNTTGCRSGYRRRFCRALFSKTEFLPRYQQDSQACSCNGVGYTSSCAIKKILREVLHLCLQGRSPSLSCPLPPMSSMHLKKRFIKRSNC